MQRVGVWNLWRLFSTESLRNDKRSNSTRSNWSIHLLQFPVLGFLVAHSYWLASAKIKLDGTLLFLKLYFKNRPEKMKLKYDFQFLYIQSTATGWVNKSAIIEGSSRLYGFLQKLLSYYMFFIGWEFYTELHTVFILSNVYRVLKTFVFNHLQIFLND